MVPGMKTVGQNGLRGLTVAVGLGMIGPPTGIGVAVGIACVVSGMVVTIELSGVMIPLKACQNPQGWWKSGPYGPLPRVFGVHGDIRWFQIAPHFQDSYFIPGKAYRTAAQLKKDTTQKRAKVQPTGIPIEMAFKQAKPPLTFKSFMEIPRNATAASNEGMFGEHKNSWLDPRTKKALQKTAKVPV